MKSFSCDSGAGEWRAGEGGHVRFIIIAFNSNVDDDDVDDVDDYALDVNDDDYGGVHLRLDFSNRFSLSVPVDIIIIIL